MRTFTSDVVGVTFVDGYPENVHRIAEIEAERHPGEGLAVVLLRERDNATDTNAVAVHVPAFGKLGFLPRGTARLIAPLLDDGARSVADLYVRIHPDHPDRPGLTVAALITKELHQ